MDIKKVFIILLVTVCFFFLEGCEDVRYNNSVDKDDLITQTYSTEDIDALKEMIRFRKVDWKQFKRIFKVECARETYQGCYVVLSLVENKNAFVFFDQENYIYNIIVLERFKTKKEFEDQVVVDQSTLEMVVSFDPSTIAVPLSRVIASVHIVQEGAFLVDYSLRKSSENVEEKVVDSIKFFSDQDILNSDDVYLRSMIPYVLEMDKFRKTGDGSKTGDGLREP